MQNFLLTQAEIESDASQPVPELAASGRTRLKVLVSAYACSPARGSEHGVGWGWVKAISKYHDLWVLTGEEDRDDIEAALAKDPALSTRVKFHYIARKRYRWAEGIWPPAYLFTYKHQWLRAAFHAGKELHKQIGFDVIHQLTYVGFRVPGWLWKLDAAFVWGPIGGLEQTTWALIPWLGLRGAVHYGARNILNDLDRRLRASPKRAFSRADGGIIAATSGVQREIRRFYRRESAVISEIGLPPITRSEPVRRNPSEPLRLLWCGYLLPGKALPFLLDALSRLPEKFNWNLAVIGKGPCKSEWQRIARARGLDHRCEWLGQIARDEVLRRMHTAHALMITSVHDLTSTVLVEALANGLPVVCPDHCGFTDAINSDCGIRVPAKSRRELVDGLRDAILRLDNEEFRLRLADGALTQSAVFEWDRKARAVSELYLKKVNQTIYAR